MSFSPTSTVRLEPLALFEGPSIEPELVLQFFLAFSRAEFALKRAGFASPYETGDGIRVEWRCFAVQIAGLFPTGSDPVEVQDAMAYLHSHPPSRQVLESGRLQWKARKPSAKQTAQSTITLVNGVRNNLFHGGKELVGGLVERDRQLLKSALILLRHCVLLQPDVRDAFNELGPAHSHAA